MSNSADESLFKAIWPTALTLLGLVSLATGLAWSMVASPGSGLTPEMVHEYNEAGSALEQASVKRERQRKGKEIPKDSAEAHQYESAFERFTKAKAELEGAKNARSSQAFWLKTIGVGLTVVGALGLLLNKR